MNIIFDSDSYKFSHFLGYPPDVTNVYSYAESRGGRYSHNLFFGLQPYLNKLIDNPVSNYDIDDAVEFAQAHGVPFNEDGWRHIAYHHNGYLPLLVKAVPEGTLVPTKNVLVTVENLDPKVPWLTSYVETALLRQVWYSTTVATRIFNMKRRIKREFELTADNFDNLPFALLDFSSRGCASYEANQIGGAAYLAHFLGSDSVPAVQYVNQHYQSQMSGFSVPATEHSIMCAWGKDREEEAFKYMIDRMGGPGKIVSVVCDTYNVYAAAEKWARMAEYVKNSGTTLVFRPDSGDPEVVLPYVISKLAEGFGATINSRGYSVINGAKVLWGDGINEKTHLDPFVIARDMRFSADNIITGSGGGLMQADIDRDTCKFAFKASAISRDEGQTWEGISKDPATDPTKRSKEGRLYLIGNGSQATPYRTMIAEPGAIPAYDMLRTVYYNGDLMNYQDIDGIRKRIDAQL